MKLHLPTKLLAALVASFTSITSVTVGTTGLIGMSAVVISVSSMAQAADVTLDGTKITLPSSGTASYDTATVTASTTVEYGGRGTITLGSLAGDAADTVITVNRIAADSGNVSYLYLTGEGDYNGTVALQSNTNVLANNMVLILQDAKALQNASVKLGGGSNAGRSVLQIDTDATIAALLRDGSKGVLTDGGAGKTLSITGGDSVFSGMFDGKITVDYIGTGKFTLGNNNKDAALSAPASSADATLKISKGTLELFSGAATWAQKLVMGDNTTIIIEDGARVTNWGGYGVEDTAENAGYKFTGDVSFGSGVNLNSYWGKNMAISGVLTAADGFAISGGAAEYSYYNLANDNNNIDGKISITRNWVSLGITSSGSLGNATVETSSTSQYITYFGTKGASADVIGNEMTGGGNFTVASGWVHLSDKVDLQGTYRVDSDAILSKVGTIKNLSLNGGRIDAGNGDLTLEAISGSGILSATGGKLTLTGISTLDGNYGVLVNGSGSLLSSAGALTVDGATLYWNSETDTSSVLAGVDLKSGSIDLSGYSAYADVLGTDTLKSLEIDLGLDLSGGDFSIVGLEESAYQLDSTSGTTVVKFLTTGGVDLSWPTEWGIADGPSSALGQTVSQEINPMYNPAKLDATYGSVNLVLSTGSATKVGVYGGYASDVAPGAVNSDIWLTVDGGDYKRIVGGSYANNWGGGAKCDINGDIHLSVGGDTKADFIIGGNYKDGQGPTIDGSIYVAVEDDAVIRGSLIGGVNHQHNGTTNITGDITVVIKNVQDTTDTSLSDISTPIGYIIGGSVHAYNYTANSSVQNTSVLIDTGDQTGKFVKNIVGGHCVPNGSGHWGSGWGAYNIIGDTLVDIKASDEVEFTGSIVAGSHSVQSGLATVKGNSTLSIDGGTYSGVLYAGSNAAEVAIEGDVSLIFKSGVIAESSALNGSAGSVGGSSVLTLGGGNSITFNDTKVSNFDLVEFVQGTTYEGNLSLNGCDSLAILGAEGTGISLNGQLSLDAEGVLKLDMTQYGELADGEVVFSTSGLTNINGLAYDLASGVNGILKIDGNNVVFSSAVLIWDGGTGAEWGATDVWNLAGADATYTDGQAVVVNDITGVDKTTLTLTEAVSPASVTITNSATTVELTGAGSITNSVMTKGGDGLLVLGSDTVLGAGTKLNVNSGILAYGYTTDAVDFANITFSSDAALGVTNAATLTLSLSGTDPVASAWADKDSTFVADVSADTVWSGDVLAGDGVVKKTGAGALVMTGNNEGNIVIASGNFHMGNGAHNNVTSVLNWGAEGSSVTMQDGTTLVFGNRGGHATINSDLVLGENASDSVTVRWYDATQASDADYQFNLKGNVTVNGNVTLTSYDSSSKAWAKEVALVNTLLGEGTLIAGRAAGDGQYNSNGKLILDCDASGFEGVITIDATNNYSYALDLRQSLANATVNLNSGDSAEYRAFIRVLNNVEIGELNGTANSLVGAATGEFTLTVGGGNYSGSLKDKSYALAYGQTTANEAGVGKLSLIKTSSADLTLGGLVELTGSVSVNEGKLLLTSTGAASVGDLTIAKGSQMTTAGDLNLGSNLSLGVNADMVSLIVGGAFEGGVYALTLEGLADLTDEGEYELITALSGLSTDKSSFNWTDAGDNDLLGFTLEQTATSLKLVATSKGETWIYQADNATWSDADLGTEWGNTNTVDSVAGKDVVFNKTAFEDASFDGTVTIEGDVAPNSILVNTPDDKAYTFVSDTTTPGAITGAAALTKKGNGSLTMDLANTNWTGDIAVAAGELVGNVANSLGSGAISVDGGTLTLNDAAATAGQVDLVSGALNLTDGAYATNLIKSWTAGTLTLGDADSSASITLGRDLLNGKTAVVNDGSTLRIDTLAQMGAFAMEASGTGTIIANWTHQGNYSAQSMNLSTNFQGTLEVEDGCFRIDAITMGEDAVLKLHNAVNAEQNRANHTYVNDIVFADDDVRMETTSSAYTLSGDLSGKAFSKYSNGQLIMDGGIDLAGSLQVNAGTLVVGANATVTKLADSVELAGGTLSIAQSAMSYDGVVSGTSGKLSVADGAQLTLTAANTATATLEVLDSGSVTLSGDSVAWAGALSGSGIVNLEAANGINITAGNTGLTGQVNVNSGSATLAGADSLGTADVSVGGGSLDMASAAVANDVTITSGKLVNATNFAGKLTVNATAGTADTENSINLGGATAVDSLTLAADSSITGLGGALDMSGKSVDMTLTDDNVSVGSTPGEAMVDADLTLTAANTKLDLTNQALLDILTANKQSTDGVGLVLSSGSLTVDAPGSITFAPVLTSLGYVVTGVDGGALTISGNADLAYTVTDDTTSDPDTITDYAALDPYKSVAIGDEKTLTVNLDGAPDASRSGEGVKLTDLVGTEGTSLQVNNTAADADTNKAVVDFVQNSATSFEGDIAGDNVDFVKKGTESLAVEGTITGEGSSLNVTEGSMALNGDGNELDSISTNGGDVTIGGDTTVDSLSGTSGTMEVADGKTLAVEAQDAADTLEGTTLSGSGSLAIGSEASASDMVLGAGSVIDGLAVDVAEGSSLTLDSGSSNAMSGLSGTGALDMNDATLEIAATDTQSFSGDIEGAGAINVTSGTQAISGAGNSDVALSVQNGATLTLEGSPASTSGDPAKASYQSLDVADGSTLNIGSNDVPKTQLEVAGDFNVGAGSTVNITTSSTTVEDLGAPFVTAGGAVSIGDGATITTTNLDTLVSSDSAQLNMELFKGASVSLGNNVVLNDAILSSMFDGVQLAMNADGTAIILTGTGRTENVFADDSLTENAAAGADLLWDARYEMGNDSVLRDLYSAVLADMNAGKTAAAAQKMAAAAGSTVTALGAAQKDQLRDQMLMVRNRTTLMGVNPAYVNEELPYFHIWMEGTGSTSELDSDGDESGYKLSTFGGTVGVDVDLSDSLTLGAAFSASYGDIDAQAADIAEGDFDSYYASIFARYQSKKWAHTLILTGGWVDASLTRTVNYGAGSYEAEGDTTGSGFGAMYELTYDIALNEDRSSILQPLFNASIMKTTMDGYTESGSAGNAALQVEDQEWTTGSVAVGARWMGLVGSNIFGREALAEVRVNVAQDFGDNQGEANVGFIGNPGYTRSVRGAEIGKTAVQIGAGLSVPVGYQGTIFVNGNADLRDGATSFNGSVGYRYDF